MSCNVDVQLEDSKYQSSVIDVPEHCVFKDAVGDLCLRLEGGFLLIRQGHVRIQSYHGPKRQGPRDPVEIINDAHVDIVVRKVTHDTS